MNDGNQKTPDQAIAELEEVCSDLAGGIDAMAPSLRQYPNEAQRTKLAATFGRLKTACERALEAIKAPETR